MYIDAQMRATLQEMWFKGMYFYAPFSSPKVRVPTRVVRSQIVFLTTHPLPSSTVLSPGQSFYLGAEELRNVKHIITNWAVTKRSKCFLPSLYHLSQLNQSSDLACCATAQTLVLASLGQCQASMGKRERKKCLSLYCTVAMAVMLWPLNQF